MLVVRFECLVLCQYIPSGLFGDYTLSFMTDRLWNVHLVSDPLGRRFFTTSSKTLFRLGEREKNVEKPARFAIS
jgi:hypothetical protein